MKDWRPRLALFQPDERLLLSGIMDGEDIAAVSAKDKGLITLFGKSEPIYIGSSLTPEELSATDFDYLIFFGAERMLEVHGLFTKMGVHAGKIANASYYITHLRGRQFYSLDDAMLICDVFTHVGARRVLDADMFFAVGQDYAGSLFRDGAGSVSFTGLDAKGRKFFPAYGNLYSEIVREMPAPSHFDAILFTLSRGSGECLSLLADTYDMSGMTIFYVMHRTEAWEGLHSHDLSFLGNITWLDTAGGALLCIEKKQRDDVKIFVAAHKPYPLPHLPPCYAPIHAGRAGKPQLPFAGDDTGDNISGLNGIINELTAMYWIYKNTSSGYVGFTHYHRYFVKTPHTSPLATPDVLTASDVRDILADFDVILVRELITRGTNVEQIAHDIGEAAALTALSLIREEMAVTSPGYVEALDYVAYGEGLFRCNMMVTRRFVFDAYCSWLFSFITRAAVRFSQAKSWTGKAARGAGFWGERMLTVWLLMQPLRIRETDMAELPHDITT